MSDKAWEIPDVTPVPTFLRALLDQVSTTVTVSFEIHRPASEVNLIYLRHRSDAQYHPWRDTIFPRTRLYLCNLTHELVSDLNRLLESHEPGKVFWHIKGFIDGNLVFWIHDADMGESALLSPKLSSATVRSIALALKRETAQVDTDINWDGDWKGLKKPEKRREAKKPL